jgi:hypothetical protein
MDWGQITVIVVIILTLIVLYMRYADHVSYLDLQKVYDKRPIIWVYIDDSDVNTRFWSDFGARSSRALNVPFLNLCYRTIQKAAGDNYRVELISGVADAISKLGGSSVSQSNRPIPERLLGYGQKKMLTPLDEAYIRTAILERYGGLWVPLSTIFLRPLPILPTDRAVFFGTNQSDLYSGSAGTAVPGHAVFWSPTPGHAVYTEWADMLQHRMEEGNGGSWIRGDDALDMDSLLAKYKDTAISTLPGAALDRKPNGKTIGIEDWLAHGTGGELPFAINKDSIFMPVDYTELVRRRAYGWFLKMSESQISESDLVVKYLLELF